MAIGGLVCLNMDDGEKTLDLETFGFFVLVLCVKKNQHAPVGCF